MFAEITLANRDKVRLREKRRELRRKRRESGSNPHLQEVEGLG
jgi:hypothetical protein